MKKEYDVKKLKVKRRGVMPGLKDQEISSAKIKITISLDNDVIEYFKLNAEKPGALPYQTQINQALRTIINSDDDQHNIKEIKDELLNDSSFINKVVKLVSQKKRASK